MSKSFYFDLISFLSTLFFNKLNTYIMLRIFFISFYKTKIWFYINMCIFFFSPFSQGNYTTKTFSYYKWYFGNNFLSTWGEEGKIRVENNNSQKLAFTFNLWVITSFIPYFAYYTSKRTKTYKADFLKVQK